MTAIGLRATERPSSFVLTGPTRIAAKPAMSFGRREIRRTEAVKSGVVGAGFWLGRKGLVLVEDINLS